MISLGGGGQGELGTRCNLCSPAWCWFQGCTITPGFINSCRYSKCHCKHAHVYLNVRTVYLAWVQLPYSLASRYGSFLALLTPTSLMSRKPKPPEEKHLSSFPWTSLLDLKTSETFSVLSSHFTGGPLETRAVPSSSFWFMSNRFRLSATKRRH